MIFSESRAPTFPDHALPLVNREPADQILHLLAHVLPPPRHLRRRPFAPTHQALRQSCRQPAGLGDAEAAGGAGRRAEPHARGDRGLFRIERDAVLVAGDVGAAERCLRDLPGQLLLLRSTDQTGVGAAVDDIVGRGLHVSEAPWRRSDSDDVLAEFMYGWSASPNATPFAAMTCISGPPCRRGSTA